jgi:hypothetical protein
MKTYTILNGTFVDSVDGKDVIRQPGEQITLEDDVAALHVGKLQPEQEPAAQGDDTLAGSDTKAGELGNDTVGGDHTE